MVDPAKTLIGELEREVSSLPGASFFPGAGSDAAARFQAAMGRWAPPGFAAFLSAHDGGVLGSDIKILTLAEAAQRRAESERDSGRSGTLARRSVAGHGARRTAVRARRGGGDHRR